VETLIRSGAEVKEADESRMTALHIAAIQVSFILAAWGY
jgi:ankyrin repeat protein